MKSIKNFKSKALVNAKAVNGGALPPSSSDLPMNTLECLYPTGMVKGSLGSTSPGGNGWSSEYGDNDYAFNGDL
jgi:hypothetical protein